MSPGHGTRRKVNKHLTNPESLDTETWAEIQGFFNKVRTYAKPPGERWCIPPPNLALSDLPQQQNCRLQELKTSLNTVKNRLSDKNVEVWHQHTNSTNWAGKVMSVVRSAANPEICTQAWCKFYEILGSFNLFPDEALQKGELNTVHLCEAPGAFITALNHYIKTSNSTRYCDWVWAANTLNPYNEANGGSRTIADDRLISKTLPWWFFGSDNTGDIMIQKHLLELQTFVSNMHRVDLVTADGSFDCQENPDEQEALVASLHYCEVCAALLLLSPGGSLVLKMFTLYEHSSICLLYLLNCCFSSVSVFKPATSKAGNSEVYVVCLNYDDKEAVKPLLSKMIRNYGPNIADQEALFPSSLIPESFLKQHEDVCLYFHTMQVKTITGNLQLFEGMSTEQRQRLDLIRDSVADKYLQHFQVSFLPRSRWVSRSTVRPACCRVSAGRPLGQKKQTGSFNERRELQTLSWRERIQRGTHSTWIQTHSSEDGGTSLMLEGPLMSCPVESWCVIVGKALPVVRNSAFCEGGLISHLNEALTDSAVDWNQIPSCDLCQVASTASILSEVAGLCAFKEDGEDKATKKQCLVFGSHSVWGVCGSQIGDLILTFCAEPSLPQRDCVLQHDGEPTYQQQLLSGLLWSLQTLSSGDALLLPLLSALTRVTAGVVFCLHACFRSVLYRSFPFSGMVGAVLVCVGFCPEAAVPLRPILTDLQENFSQLIEGVRDSTNKAPAADRQVLQFVPMEELLSGGLTDFLWTMNTEIIQRKLHLLMQS